MKAVGYSIAFEDCGTRVFTFSICELKRNRLSNFRIASIALFQSLYVSFAISANYGCDCITRSGKILADKNDTFDNLMSMYRNTYVILQIHKYACKYTSFEVRSDECLKTKRMDRLTTPNIRFRTFYNRVTNYLPETYFFHRKIVLCHCTVIASYYTRFVLLARQISRHRACSTAQLSHRNYET